MTFKLGDRSLKRLRPVHPDLHAVVRLAITLTETDFTVLEGKRTLKRQKQLFKRGATKTLNSRHLTGHAVDLGAWVEGSVSWDWNHYHKISDAMFLAAKTLGVTIEWGGHWKSFPDGPHYQLPWAEYPKGS